MYIPLIDITECSLMYMFVGLQGLFNFCWILRLWWQWLLLQDSCHTFTFCWKCSTQPGAAHVWFLLQLIWLCHSCFTFGTYFCAKSHKWTLLIPHATPVPVHCDFLAYWCGITFITYFALYCLFNNLMNCVSVKFLFFQYSSLGTELLFLDLDWQMQVHSSACPGWAREDGCIGMWCHIIQRIHTDISEEIAASTFSSEY